MTTLRKRGRKSAASLTVVPIDVSNRIERPEPLPELTDAQAEVWRSVVDSLPADWFGRETHALLAQFTRHVVCARRVAQLIEQWEKGSGQEITILDYERLLRMQEVEGRALSSLATRMRLTQQATVKHEQARKPSLVEKPWDTD
jgi:hypothetical protein